jgi:hypothetical protein
MAWLVPDAHSTTLARYGKMGGGWRSGGMLCWRATCQGIANWKLIERLWAGAGEGLPRRQFPPISIDFPMPQKTRSATWKTASGRARADCRRFHSGYLSFDSDALQAGTGWHSANHGSIGDSRPTAFLGYPRGHTVSVETRRVVPAPPNPSKDTHPRTRAPKNRKHLPQWNLGMSRFCRAQAACVIRYLGSNASPFFHMIKAMAAILRAKVRRASSGFMPLANRRS